MFVAGVQHVHLEPGQRRSYSRDHSHAHQRCLRHYR
jgi:hypothetical protein